MATQTHLGRSKSKRRTSGKLLFSPTHPTELIISGGGAIDFGNIISWKRVKGEERLEHLASRNGTRYVDFEESTKLKYGYQFVCDEHTDFSAIVRQKGRAGAGTTTTLGGTGLTATFTGVEKGATYWVGRYNVRSVAVTVGVTAKTVDVDFDLDPLTGRIRILPTGTINDGDNVGVAFAADTCVSVANIAGNMPRIEGNFVFIEYGQVQMKSVPPALYVAPVDGPVAEHRWNGSLWISDEGDNNLTAFNTFTLESTCHSLPVIVDFTQPAAGQLP